MIQFGRLFPKKLLILLKVFANSNTHTIDMLIKDSSKRPSIRNVLDHPWLGRYNKEAWEGRRVAQEPNIFQVYSQSPTKAAEKTLKKHSSFDS